MMALFTNHSSAARIHPDLLVDNTFCSEVIPSMQAIFMDIADCGHHYFQC